ncbi:MAG: DUF6152 family protein [Gammaproteobacteria bacterium]|nr:DUF6152 family protein [Gammaproteobacteria bacterium]
MTTRLGQFIVFTLGVIVGVPSLAHHSTAEYDNNTITEAEGTVVDVSWFNPHVRLTVSTEAFDGETMLWELEGMGVMRLDRAGIPRDLVSIGTTVRFAGNPSTRRSRHMYVTNVLMPDGQEILLRTTSEPRWSEDLISIRGGSVIDPALVTADQPEGIFRVWVPAGNQAPAWAADPPLTAAARAARDAYDPTRDDPLLDCTAPGMPRLISRAGGHPLRFSMRNEDIILGNEYFAVERLVRMDGSSAPAGLEPTPLGYSTGRWENGDLVITTTHIDWPYFQLYGLEGVPQSNAVELVERFMFDESSDTLSYNITVTDPETFTQTLTAEDYIQFRWEPGLYFLPYECVMVR